MPPRRRLVGTSLLQNRLVLHRFICREFGYDDLRTIAFQSATGSGKTLLMHAHILQYRHYLSASGGRLNNIVLLTPNEQMSVQHDTERPVLPGPGAGQPVTLDLYSRLQSVASSDVVAEQSAPKKSVKLPLGQVAFFNRSRLYDKLLKRKQQRGWHNLIIERDTVDRLLERDDWYELFKGLSRYGSREQHKISLLSEADDRPCFGTGVSHFL